MKNFIFVSDFDGTLTKIDFYRILIDKYLNDFGERIYKDWQSGKLKDVEALDIIYSSTGRTDAELQEDIFSIELDPFFQTFLSEVESSGGDFLILSAGTSYYIERFFAHKGIKGVTIIGNKGIYKDNGLHLVVDKKSPFYSERHGIDKAKVVMALKQKYSKLYFAGDSTPDVGPAKLADVVFATGKLKKMLDDIRQPYIPFNNLKEIQNHLINMGVLKND